MLPGLLKGLLGRLVGYGVFLLGFWLLVKGFVGPSLPSAALGGIGILAGMYLMVAARRAGVASGAFYRASIKEGGRVDSLDGSDQGNKLPPQ